MTGVLSHIFGKGVARDEGKRVRKLGPNAEAPNPVVSGGAIGAFWQVRKMLRSVLN